MSLLRTWMFALAFLIAAPALAQEADPQPDSEASEDASEEQTDEWAGIPPRVERLELGGKRVLLAVPQDDAPAAAIVALTSAIQAQKPTLFIDDSALGLAPETPDKSIVEAALNQPVDLVVIARFFPPAPTLVVSVYRLDGTGAGNFALERGDTSAPAQPTLAIADDGVASSDSEPSSDPNAESEPTGPTAEQVEEYETKKWSLVSFDDSGIVIRNGATGEELRDVQALELLGKSDLAAAMSDNLALKRGLYWTGAGVAGAGLVALLVGFFTIPSAFESEQDIPTGNIVAVVGGFSGIFVGILTAVVGWNIDAIDATRKEARGWVKDLNAPMRQRLEIPDHLARTPGNRPAIAFTWTF